MAKNFQNINSEFLLNLLLEENKHLTIIDFIDKEHGSFACVCVSLALAEKYQEIQNIFTNSEIFTEKYFVIYADALDKFRIITNNRIRQIFIDETLKLFPLMLKNKTVKNLSTNTNNVNDAINLLHSVRNNHSYALILRDDIMFIIMHYNENEFIIIDPHVEYCGILTERQIFRYVTYNGVWDFDVHIFMSNNIITQDNSELNQTNTIEIPSINLTTQNTGSNNSINIENINVLDS